MTLLEDDPIAHVRACFDPESEMRRPEYGELATICALAIACWPEPARNELSAWLWHVGFLQLSAAARTMRAECAKPRAARLYA